jgi:predicted ATPase/class 3 adenylate cyclase
MTTDGSRVTVTLLFTDIEGSTRLLSQASDRYTEALEAHRRILRAAFSGGREMRTEGDSFFIVFASVREAVAGAVRAQRELTAHAWPDGCAVRVRMGLHTGEATPTGDDLVGLDVHRAARIAAAAHGGQVIISDATRAVLGAALPEGVTLRDLGEHRLKDLAQPERLYQLLADGLRSEFPPLRSLDATPNNLPLQLTSFVGREREIARAKQLLERTRLLTLTGPGGTGKTRLSLQLAADVADAFVHGVYFVPLAAITDAGLVPSAIAQALGLTDSGARPPLERVIEHVRDKRLLLLLDNFEQLTSASDVLGTLLKAAADLKIVVTSRAVLRVYGEQEFSVPPLALPDKTAQTADSVSQYEAVRLFIERAVAVKPDFNVTNENAPAIAEICARLDGLPLAIELAAARIKVLAPQAMLARLERRLSMLSSGSRDLPARQQTLRGAIAWSYDLLDEGGRRLFARFAVFVRGGALEQVEAVCGPAEEIGADVLDGIAALVDHSLLRTLAQAKQERYLMLQTIREFALERLEAGGEAETIRARHARAFLELAERAGPNLIGPQQAEWLDRLEAEHDNMRAALEWALAAAESAIALRLGGALWRFWQIRGHLLEGRRRIEAVVAMPRARDHPAALAAALEAAGGVAYWQGDMPAAERFYADCLEIRRQLGQPIGIANALYNLAFAHYVPRTDIPQAMSLLEEALRIFRERGDREGVAKSLWAMASANVAAGKFADAMRLGEESIRANRELGKPFFLGWALKVTGGAATRSGRLAEARAFFRESLEIFAAAHDVSGVALLLDDFAELAVLEGDQLRAIRLAGAAGALQRSTGTQLARLVNEFMERTNRPVDSDAAATAWAEGQAMSLEMAVDYALERSPSTVGAS